MNRRILVHIQDLIDVAPYDSEAAMMREIRELADEINGALPDYECAFLHLDTQGHLAFVKEDPEAGAFWREQERERREFIEGMLPPEEDSEK